MRLRWRYFVYRFTADQVFRVRTRNIVCTPFLYATSLYYNIIIVVWNIILYYYMNTNNMFIVSIITGCDLWRLFTTKIYLLIMSFYNCCSIAPPPPPPSGKADHVIRCRSVGVYGWGLSGWWGGTLLRVCTSDRLSTTFTQRDVARSLRRAPTPRLIEQHEFRFLTIIILYNRTIGTIVVRTAKSRMANDRFFYCYYY